MPDLIRHPEDHLFLGSRRRDHDETVNPCGAARRGRQGGYAIKGRGGKGEGRSRDFQVRGLEVWDLFHEVLADLFLEAFFDLSNALSRDAPAGPDLLEGLGLVR